MAKRLDGKKIATGLLAAAAMYYLWGLVSGDFSSPDASGGDGAEPDVPVDTGGTSLDVQEPDKPEITPRPETAPPIPSVPTPEVQAPTADQTQGLQNQPQPTAQAQPAQPAAPPPQAPAPPAGGSLKLGGDQADTGIIGRTAKWFQGLSPGAQAVLAGGVSGGAGVAIQALGQKHAMEFAREKEDRARDDRTRRGAIQAFSLDSFRSKAA